VVFQEKVVGMGERFHELQMKPAGGGWTGWHLAKGENWTRVGCYTRKMGSARGTTLFMGFITRTGRDSREAKLWYEALAFSKQSTRRSEGVGEKR